MSRILRSLACLGLLVGASGAALAAKVKPPSAIFGEATTSIVAVRFVEVGPTGRLVFRRVEKLGGNDEIPELIDVSGPAELPGLIDHKDTYLIAYTRYRREAERLIVNRLGAQLLVSAGMEPALWRDTKKAREMLAWNPGKGEEAQKQRLPELIALLDASDPQFQNFAAAEIVLRPSLTKHLDAAARERLRAFARGQGGHVAARTRLLEAASQKLAGFDEPQWREIAQHVLAVTPTRVQQTDGYASLVRFAFAILENGREVTAPGVLERWVASDNAALAEASLLALRREAPERELAALEATLSLSLLPAGTREFLLDHRRRLVAATASTAR